jgi:hypothetical protein
MVTARLGEPESFNTLLNQIYEPPAIGMPVKFADMLLT